jgi:hypothetical protein
MVWASPRSLSMKRAGMGKNIADVIARATVHPMSLVYGRPLAVRRRHRDRDLLIDEWAVEQHAC